MNLNIKAKDFIRIHHLKKLLDKHKNKPFHKKILIYTAFCLTTLFAAFFIFFTLFILVIAITLPDVYDLERYVASQSSQILAQDGSTLYTIFGEEKRTNIAFDQIPQNIINATIAIEDDIFYEHSGIDIKAIFAAIFSELTFQKNRGGSTITQQYVKNTFLNSQKRYTRKIKEILMALKVEQFRTKDEILNLYLNRIPYGNNAYGIEEASKTYFGKHAKDLTLAESVILASLPQAPSYYSPYGEHTYPKLDHVFAENEINSRNITKHSDLMDDEFWAGLIGKEVSLDSENKYKIYLSGRTDSVLKRMFDLGYINEDERKQALADLQTIEFKKLIEQIKAPHFVLWVKDVLEKKYGRELLERGGLKIYTTLDLKLQEEAEKIIKEKAEFNLANYNANNASLISMNPKTGAILAMVGSVDFWNDEIDGKVNMALSYVPVGSAYKPFVYANGFLNHGLAPATVIYDVATNFGDGKYPKNYDGTFMGPITIRKALGQSRNIPALKAYFLSGEQKEILPFTQKLGMEYQDPDTEHGPSLALGPTTIKFLSFVEAYSVFANQGIHKDPFAILKIENADGEIIEEWKDPKGEEVLDPQIAYLINDILSDTSVRLGGNLTLNGRVNAAKTGTSTKLDPNNPEIRLPKDVLAIGYTPSLLTGMWIGNTNGAALKNPADGYNTVAPMWKKFMEFALQGTPSENFVRPAGITEITVSSATGLIPSENTPEDMRRTDKFASFALPTKIEDPSLFEKVKFDKTTKKIATEFCPPELIEEKIVWRHRSQFPRYFLWDTGVKNWAASSADYISYEACDLHTLDTFANAPSIYIKFPQAFSVIEKGKNLPIDLNVNAFYGVEKIEIFMNDVLRGTLTSEPYSTSIFVRPDFENGQEVELKAKLTDTYHYTSQASIMLKISDSDNNQKNEPTSDIDGVINSVDEIKTENENKDLIDSGEIIE